MAKESGYFELITSMPGEIPSIKYRFCLFLEIHSSGGEDKRYFSIKEINTLNRLFPRFNLCSGSSVG